MVTTSRSLNWGYRPHVEARSEAMIDRTGFVADGEFGSLEDLEVGTEGGGRLNPESFIGETTPHDPLSDKKEYDIRKCGRFD